MGRIDSNEVHIYLVENQACLSDKKIFMISNFVLIIDFSFFCIIRAPKSPLVYLDTRSVHIPRIN